MKLIPYLVIGLFVLWPIVGFFQNFLIPVYQDVTSATYTVVRPAPVQPPLPTAPTPAPSTPRTLSVVEKARECEAWVKERVRFAQDVRGDHWSMPAETLARGTGDCEDFVFVMLERLRVRYGLRGAFAIMHYPAHGPNLYHAEVVVDGVHYLRPVDLRPSQLAQGKLVLTYTEAEAKQEAKNHP